MNLIINLKACPFDAQYRFWCKVLGGDQYLIHEAAPYTNMILSVIYMGACTWAAARLNGNLRADTCQKHDACSYMDQKITPLHALVPLCLAFGAVIIMDVPSATLTSVLKVRRIKHSIGRLLLLTPLLVLMGSAFRLYPALSTIIISHSVVFFFSFKCNFTSWYENAITTLCLLLLFGWTLHEGPPIPVIESPGVEVCCGYLTHLSGVVAAHLYIPALDWFVEKLL